MSTHYRSAPLEPLPETLPTALGKLVYLYLRERGEATVVELRDALDVPQLRLYPTVSTLERRGLVARDGDAVRLADAAAPAERER